jgi:hypothetical protein
MENATLEQREQILSDDYRNCSDDLVTLQAMNIDNMSMAEKISHAKKVVDARSKQEQINKQLIKLTQARITEFKRQERKQVVEPVQMPEETYSTACAAIQQLGISVNDFIKEHKKRSSNTASTLTQLSQEQREMIRNVVVGLLKQFYTTNETAKLASEHPDIAALGIKVTQTMISNTFSMSTAKVTLYQPVFDDNDNIINYDLEQSYTLGGQGQRPRWIAEAESKGCTRQMMAKKIISQ